jgi:hypothetical protein
VINKLEVVPEYRGNSFVLCKIRIKAWRADKPGGLRSGNRYLVTPPLLQLQVSL